MGIEQTGRTSNRMSARFDFGAFVTRHRSSPPVEFLLRDVGARYAILGTVAVEQPDLLKAAVAAFGDAIVVGIDAREGQVATRGWTAATRVDAVDLACEVAALGVKRIIYTDIARDGRLKGPNLETTREIARQAFNQGNDLLVASVLGIGFYVAIAGWRASLPDLLVTGFGLGQAMIGGQHPHVMTAGTERAHGALPDQLIAAQVVGRVHVPDGENAPRSTHDSSR